MPVAKIENGNWPHPTRLPLGCGWNGHCTAPGHEQEVPTQDILEAFCNLGYASSCGWAPPERRWDAVRFAVAAPPLGRKPKSSSNQVSLLRLSYVCERDNRPVDHGELAYDFSQMMWLNLHADTRIQKMAECFLESYLKKKA